MKLAENEIVCFICREIIKIEDSKEAVSSVEWGSCNSGKPRWDRCCKHHETDQFGNVKGWLYA